jgi:hypothetical protein
VQPQVLYFRPVRQDASMQLPAKCGLFESIRFNGPRALLLFWVRRVHRP